MSLYKIDFFNYKLQNSSKQSNVSLSYQTFGKAIGSAPLVVVNHALTGNSQVCGEKGWWKSLIGEDKVIDTNKYSVLAFNIPGNGYLEDENLVDKYKDFTTYDIAKLFWKGIDSFKINHVFAIIGGSLGGAIAWEMLAQRPNSIQNLVPIATNLISSDWLIANVLIQDRILNHSSNPIHDARLHAMLLYRTPESFQQKFNRKLQNENLYQVESWLLHHGEKLKERFQLKAYKLMNHLLKTTNVFKEYKRSVEFYSKIKANICLVSIDSDYFFTAKEIKETHSKLINNKVKATYNEIQSIHGHDAFLIEYEQLNKILKPIFN